MHQWGGTSVVAEAVFIGDGVRFVRQSGERAVEHRLGAVGHGFTWSMSCSGAGSRAARGAGKGRKPGAT